MEHICPSVTLALPPSPPLPFTLHCTLCAHDHYLLVVPQDHHAVFCPSAFT